MLNKFIKQCKIKCYEYSYYKIIVELIYMIY